MSANWLLIAVVAIISISVLRGIFKGILALLYSLCAMILCIVIAYAASPYVNAFVRANTDWHESLSQSIEATLEEQAKEKLSGEISSAQGAEDEDSHDPNSFADNAAVLFSAVAESAGVYEEIASAITDKVFSAGAFLAVFVAARIVFAILYHVMRKAAHLPVLSAINRFGGAIAGGVEGVMLSWILMTVVVCLGITAFGGSAAQCIANSEFLTVFYKQNPLMMMV